MMNRQKILECLIIRLVGPSGILIRSCRGHSCVVKMDCPSTNPLLVVCRSFCSISCVDHNVSEKRRVAKMNQQIKDLYELLDVYRDSNLRLNRILESLLERTKSIFLQKLFILSSRSKVRLPISPTWSKKLRYDAFECFTVVGCGKESFRSSQWTYFFDQHQLSCSLLTEFVATGHS